MLCFWTLPSIVIVRANSPLIGIGGEGLVGLGHLVEQAASLGVDLRRLGERLGASGRQAQDEGPDQKRFQREVSFAMVRGARPDPSGIHAGPKSPAPLYPVDVLTTRQPGARPASGDRSAALGIAHPPSGRRSADGIRRESVPARMSDRTSREV